MLGAAIKHSESVIGECACIVRAALLRQRLVWTLGNAPASFATSRTWPVQKGHTRNYRRGEALRTSQTRDHAVGIFVAP